MNRLETTLLDRVDQVLVAHKERELRSTTGLQATVEELVLRLQGLEQAVHEIAVEVQRLAEVRSR